MCQGHHAAGRERVDPGAAGRAPAPLPPTPSARGRLVDLTHPFGVGITVADFAAPARVEASDFAARGFRNQRWTFVEHSGPPVDAPAHLFPARADAASLPPGALIARVAALRLPPAGDDDEPTLGVEA